MHSKPALILLAIVVLMFSWNVLRQVGKLRETHKNKEVQEAKVQDLEKRKARLSFEIEKLDTNAGREEIIRENFGLVKEGEKLIVIVENKKTEKIEAPVKSTRIFDFFKNLFK